MAERQLLPFLRLRKIHTALPKAAAAATAAMTTPASHSEMKDSGRSIWC